MKEFLRLCLHATNNTESVSFVSMEVKLFCFFNKVKMPIGNTLLKLSITGWRKEIK